jgi:hypothetical protein
MARRATSSAVRLAADPPLTRIPVAASSKPTNCPSQRKVWCSTATAVGPDRHDVRFWSAADTSRSAATPTGAGGDCT